METTLQKIESVIAKVIGFAGCVLMTIFAGMFGFISLACLVMSIINCDLFDVVACVVCGLIAAWCWVLRRETLM